MVESFAELFEESLKESDLNPGSIVRGTVIAINDNFVTVYAGLKSEGLIPVSQFKNEFGQLDVNVGDEVDVAVEVLEDGYGETRLSREKARRYEAWGRLQKAFDEQALVTGIINGKVKGGFTVELENVRAFLPGSLVDVRPVRDSSHLEGKPLEFKVIKIDAKRNNVVVSRRAVLEQESVGDKEALLQTLSEGMEVKGLVKNLTDYGAFIDLGGVDGLLHITDMAWKRIKHPSELLNIGDEISVKVLKFDRDKNRVSLGFKQLTEDPWLAVTKKYPEGARVSAKITNLTDYGCFAEIENGVEGLVHVSEMDWTNKNIHPSKVVNLGDEVEVLVLDIDEERRRISLGMKQCKPNPWEEFATHHNKGEKVSGKIKSITDFGIFIGLDGNIDGLIHLSDLSWEEAGEEVVRRYKKGEDLEAVILSIDSERERISLGVKQLKDDPFSMYLANNEKGVIVPAIVRKVEPKAAIVELVEGVEAILRASEISKDRVEDARTKLNEGETIEVKIIAVDRKKREILVSIKAKDQDKYEKDEKPARTEKTADSAAPKTIGDLIKQQMDNLSGN